MKLPEYARSALRDVIYANVEELVARNDGKHREEILKAKDKLFELQIQKFEEYFAPVLAAIWDDGFDTAMDDLGASLFIAEHGEDLNPFRGAEQ